MHSHYKSTVPLKLEVPSTQHTACGTIDHMNHTRPCRLSWVQELGPMPIPWEKEHLSLAKALCQVTSQASSNMTSSSVPGSSFCSISIIILYRFSTLFIGASARHFVRCVNRHFVRSVTRYFVTRHFYVWNVGHLYFSSGPNVSKYLGQGNVYYGGPIFT